MKILFTAAAFFCFSAGQAQNSFPKALYTSIFNSYLLPANGEFYGVFDSTDSYFAVRFDSISQSRFDSFAFLGHGKVWHRGQLTSFKAYITIDTVQQLHFNEALIQGSDSTDTTDANHWGMYATAMKVPGTQLMKCEGEIQMAEADETEYAGLFTGTFCIHYYYRKGSQFVKTMDESAGFGKEPGFYAMGFWRGRHHPEFGLVTWALANTRHQQLADGTTLLPDLRFQKDGSSSFSLIAKYPESCMKPPFQWFQ